MAASFEDLVYEYMTRPPSRLKSEAQLRGRVALCVEPYGHKVTRSAFNSWLSETRRPPGWLIPALVKVLDLNDTEELALYRSLHKVPLRPPEEGREVNKK